MDLPFDGSRFLSSRCPHWRTRTSPPHRRWWTPEKTFEDGVPIPSDRSSRSPSGNTNGILLRDPNTKEETALLNISMHFHYDKSRIITFLRRCFKIKKKEEFLTIQNGIEFKIVNLIYNFLKKNCNFFRSKGNNKKREKKCKEHQRIYSRNFLMYRRDNEYSFRHFGFDSFF